MHMNLLLPRKLNKFICRQKAWLCLPYCLAIYVILAHPTQCKGLYEDVPTYTMEDGRNVISVRLERTSDPKLQDIKVSWSKLPRVLQSVKSLIRAAPVAEWLRALIFHYRTY